MCAFGAQGVYVCLWCTRCVCVPLVHKVCMCASGAQGVYVYLWCARCVCVPLVRKVCMRVLGCVILCVAFLSGKA